MNSDFEQDRWETIKSIWRQWKSLYVMAGIIIGLLIFPALYLASTNFAELLQNLVPEAFGIGFTVFLIDRLYAIRDEKNRIKELEKELLRDASSTINSVAVAALEKMRSLGWIEGSNSLLKGKKLTKANWKGANLLGANLEDVELIQVELEGADLTDAQFGNARLYRVNLAGSILDNTDWRNSRLIYCDFSFAAGKKIMMGGAGVVRTLLYQSNLDIIAETPLSLDCDQIGSILIINSEVKGDMQVPHEDLSEADFEKVDRYWVDTIKRNKNVRTVQYVNYESGDIVDRVVNNVDWSHANLRKSHLKNTVFSKVTLIQARFSRSTVEDSVFSESSLVGADFVRASLANVVFDHIALAELNATKVVATNCSFVGSVMVAADLSKANVENTSFAECVLTKTNLQQARMTNVNFRGANLFGANLANAEFVDCQFDENTIMPDGKSWTDATQFSVFQGISRKTN